MRVSRGSFITSWKMSLADCFKRVSVSSSSPISCSGDKERDYYRYYKVNSALYNVVEAHGYGFRSTVSEDEHSRSKTSAIIALVLLRECSPSLLLICSIYFSKQDRLCTIKVNHLQYQQMRACNELQWNLTWTGLHPVVRTHLSEPLQACSLVRVEDRILYEAFPHFL